MAERPRRSKLDPAEEADFFLGGIVSPLRDYRMAWMLSRHLRLPLSRMDDLGLQPGAPTENGGFSRYRAEVELDKATFYLISNRFSGKFLLPSRRDADYLLLVYGSWYADKFPELLHSIRPLPDIQTVFPIEPRAVTRRLNLILE